MRKGSFTKRLTIAAAARIGVLLIGVCFQILLARAMLPEEYAKYAVALAGAALFGSVAAFGITRAISRFLPVIMLEGGSRTLRDAIARYFVCRVGGIAVVTAAVALLLWLSPFGWAPDPIYSDKLIFVWFILLSLQADMQSIAQSLMEDASWAVFSLIEIFARASLVALVGRVDHLDAQAVIEIWTLTSFVLLLGMTITLFVRRHHYELSRVVPSGREPNSGLLPAVQFSFALGIYLASFGYLATSPAAIRLASAPSLPPVPLAAASFIQGLINSIHSALPVHLLAAALEPALVSKISKSGDVGIAQTTLSLLLKAETIIVLFGMIVSIPIASVLLRLIAREEFSSYGYIVPIILLQVLGTSCYRILEIMAGIKLRHRIFAATLPLGIVCLLLVFMTTPRLGVSAILLWPTLEVLIRIGILRTELGKHGSKDVLDMSRLGPLLGAAGVLMILCAFATMAFDLETTALFILSILAGTAFVLLLFVLRPIRRDECEFMLERFPKIKGRALSVLLQIVH